MKVTLWHMVPFAIAVHSSAFFIPIPSGENVTESPKPESSPISVTQLPASPVVKPISKLSPTPKVKSPVPTPQPSAITLPSAAPTPQAEPEPVPSVSPSVSPSASPSVSPSASPSVSPSPSPVDSLQIDGAKPGCNGLLGCWQVAETKGRMVSEAVEQKLQAEGYVLTRQDLDDDTGMVVYEVKKDSTFQYYLHVIWSDRGTVYVKKPELVSSINELKAIAGI